MRSTTVPTPRTDPSPSDLADDGTGPGGDGIHHFEADLTFGGCRDPRCPTGRVEPTVDMS